MLLLVIRPTGRILDWAEYTGELEGGRFGIRLGRGVGYHDRALVHAGSDAVLVTTVFDEERMAEQRPGSTTGR